MMPGGICAVQTEAKQASRSEIRAKTAGELKDAKQAVWHLQIKCNEGQPRYCKGWSAVRATMQLLEGNSIASVPSAAAAQPYLQQSYALHTSVYQESVKETHQCVALTPILRDSLAPGLESFSRAVCCTLDRTRFSYAPNGMKSGNKDYVRDWWPWSRQSRVMIGVVIHQAGDAGRSGYLFQLRCRVRC